MMLNRLIHIRGSVVRRPRLNNLCKWFSSGRIYNKADICSTQQLPNRTTPHYTYATSLCSLIWETPPRNVFIVKKPWTPSVRECMVSLIELLNRKYQDKISIIVEQDTADEIENDVNCRLFTGSNELLRKKADVLITLGGDGTILHATSQFASGDDVPPVLSFSLGTLGFLLPFDIKDSENAFDSVYGSRAKVLNRARLKCDIERQGKHKRKMVHALNDLNIHRGQDPHLTMLDIEVNGQFVTQAIADGVIISTPTGSTAYSLSSGGSIVHPSVPCILISPICPRSLSFRPLIFPATAKISISMSPRSHGRPSDISIDGISRGVLNIGDKITVGTEPGRNKGIWCVARKDTDWVHNLNGLLGFNSLFGFKD